MARRSHPVTTTGFPWAWASAAGLGTAAAYFLLPLLAPGELTGVVNELLLGVVLGLVVGIALRVDRQLLVPIAVGAVVGVFVRFVGSDQNPLVSLGIAVLVGLEVWAITYLLRRTRAQRFADPGDLIAFALVVLAISVPVGLLAAGVSVVHGSSDDEFIHLAGAWVIDDLFGLMVLAPAIITFHRPSSWTWAHALEWSIAVAYTVISVWYVFFLVVPGDQGIVGWPYFIIIGSLWIAVRLGMQAVAPVVAVSFWIATVATVAGIGAFAVADVEALGRLLAVEMFCIVMALVIFALATLRDSRLVRSAEVESSARLLREVVDGSDAIIFAKSYADDGDGRGRYVLVNDRWDEVFGYEEASVVDHSDHEVLPSELADRYVEADRRVLQANSRTEAEEVLSDQRGLRRRYHVSRFPLRRADGTPWGVGGIAHDVTDIRAANEREAQQAELLNAVFEQSPTPAVRLTVKEGTGVEVTAANAAMCTLLGARPGHIEDCDLLDHVHPDDAGTALDVITTATAYTRVDDAPAIRQREVRMHTDDGRTLWVVMSVAGLHGAEGATEVVAQFEDFTARRAAEQALSDQAMRDAVTGLPNRRALLERMETALARLRRHPGFVTVLFCDLDHFKDVNDSLGHQVGDQLLVATATRLKSALRPEDTIARLGGDEFVAMGEGITDTADAVMVALRMQDRLSAPWPFQEKVFRPAMSIGIAMTSDPDVSADEILRRADLAMYRAKEGGRNRVEVYDRSVDDEVQQAVNVQHELRRAIDRDALILHYQPIVRLADGELVGAEALVRMRARDGGLMGPVEFVPHAEASGLIIPMGAWVVHRALLDLARLRAAGKEITMSVNVSPSQLREEGFAKFLLDQADNAGVKPAWISVEVTETALIHDPARSGQELAVLHDAGVRVSLDDFGTGYSSLAWLTQFPVNVVKIDKSFTDEVGIDDRKTAIVSAVISVSHELGFSVVAEGIETDEQRTRLIGLGCDWGQGYLFGRPVSIEEAPWA